MDIHTSKRNDNIISYYIIMFEFEHSIVFVSSYITLSYHTSPSLVTGQNVFY